MGLGRALITVALVVGVPGTCLVGVALYGKALSESEVAEGTLLTPEEARARAEALHRRFLAMTPAEHLAGAREALACGYDPASGTGGNFGEARRHLGAVPAGAPEAAAAAALRAELERRKASQAAGAAVRLRRVLAAHAGDAEKPCARRAVASELDRLSGSGLGCVHVADEQDVTLRFDRADCDQAMLDTVTPADTRGGLRAIGFRAVRCNNGRARVELAP